VAALVSEPSTANIACFCPSVISVIATSGFNVSVIGLVTDDTFVFFVVTFTPFLVVILRAVSLNRLTINHYQATRFIKILDQF
jgi:hypothetical protein